jgi:hypothetical protein
MAVTTKNGSKKTTANPRGPAKKTKPTSKSDFQALQSDLADARDQQNATSEILRMIARAPADPQAVLEAIAENAARMCDAVDTVVWRVDDNVLRHAAHFGPVVVQLARGEGHPITIHRIAVPSLIGKQSMSLMLKQPKPSSR